MLSGWVRALGGRALWPAPNVVADGAANIGFSSSVGRHLFSVSSMGMDSPIGTVEYTSIGDVVATPGKNPCLFDLSFDTLASDATNLPSLNLET